MRLCTDCDTMFAKSSQPNRCRPCWNTYQREWRRKAGKLKNPHPENTDTHKKCPRCDVVMERTEFYGTVGYCPPCARAWAREHPRPEKRTPAQIASKWKRRMGLTDGEYDTLLERQGGRCAICGTDSDPYRPGIRLAIDHNHDCCGKDKACHKCIRGLLCTRCNRGLAWFLDDPSLLERAAEYLSLPRLTEVI